MHQTFAGFSAQSAPAAPEAPSLRHGNQGPFGEADLLAIGSVLVAVLAILGWRKLSGSHKR